jgi:hypothetical protein
MTSQEQVSKYEPAIFHDMRASSRRVVMRA